MLLARRANSTVFSVDLFPRLLTFAIRPERSRLESGSFILAFAPNDSLNSQFLCGIINHCALFGFLILADGVRKNDAENLRPLFVVGPFVCRRQDSLPCTRSPPTYESPIAKTSPVR